MDILWLTTPGTTNDLVAINELSELVTETADLLGEDELQKSNSFIGDLDSRQSPQPRFQRKLLHEIMVSQRLHARCIIHVSMSFFIWSNNGDGSQSKPCKAG